MKSTKETLRFDFGPLAAQLDNNLLDYFHETEQINELFSNGVIPKDFIVIARPGGGKTALFKWLESSKKDSRFYFIKSVNTNLTSGDNDLNIEEYKTIVQVELFTALISESINNNYLSGELLQEAKKYINDDWKKSIGKFFKEKFEGISILGCGFNLKTEEKRDYLNTIKATGKPKKSEELIAKISNIVNLKVIIDDPEYIVGRGLDISNSDNFIRIGALLSVFGLLHSYGIQVLVFIKEHIIQGVQKNYPDYSHFSDCISGLKWSSNDLICLLNNRILTKIKSDWENVFDFTQENMIKDIFPLLINGPRDLLYLCNNTKLLNGKLHKNNILKTAAFLKNEKWDELLVQYDNQWPKIIPFTQTILRLLTNNLNKKELTKVELNKLLESELTKTSSELGQLRKSETWIYNCMWLNPKVDERLFFLGVFGYVYDRKKVFSWAGRALEKYRESEKVFISPLFLT